MLNYRYNTVVSTKMLAEVHTVLQVSIYASKELLYLILYIRSARTYRAPGDHWGALALAAKQHNHHADRNHRQFDGRPPSRPWAQRCFLYKHWYTNNC